jgi:hypothetical protein
MAECRWHSPDGAWSPLGRAKSGDGSGNGCGDGDGGGGLAGWGIGVGLKLVTMAHALILGCSGSTKHTQHTGVEASIWCLFASW